MSKPVTCWSIGIIVKVPVCCCDVFIQNILQVPWSILTNDFRTLVFFLPKFSSYYLSSLLNVCVAWAGFELTAFVVIGTDCIGRCISNYYTITTTIVICDGPLTLINTFYSQVLWLFYKIPPSQYLRNITFSSYLGTKKDNQHMHI